MLFFDSDGREVAHALLVSLKFTLYVGIIHQNLNIAYRNIGLDKQIPITPERLNLQARQVAK